MAGEIATAVGGTHPTGMHSCTNFFVTLLTILYDVPIVPYEWKIKFTTFQLEFPTRKNTLPMSIKVLDLTELGFQMLQTLETTASCSKLSPVCWSLHAYSAFL